MKVVLVDNDMLESVDFMNHLMIMGRCAFPDRVCLAAISQIEESDKYEPVGVMVCQITKDNYIVEWIYVRGDMRHEGVGKLLMSYAFKSAEIKGFNKLKLLVDDNEFRKNACPLEADFLNDYAFTQDQSIEGEWTADVKSCLLSPVFKDRTSFLKTRSFGELKPEVQSEQFGMLSVDFDAFMMNDFGSEGKNVDMDLSQVYYKDGEIEGVLLVKDTVDKVYITAISSTDDEGLKSMFYEILIKAKNKYGEDKMISLLKSARKYDSLFNEIKPDGKIGARLYSTSIEDHYNALGNVDLVSTDSVLSFVS